jgi:hypothetical protein
MNYLVVNIKHSSYDRQLQELELNHRNDDISDREDKHSCRHPKSHYRNANQTTLANTNLTALISKMFISD